MMSESLFGKTHRGETKQKMSDSRFGKTHREETKHKISEAHFGKTHRGESKQKMSEAKRGEKHPRSKRVYQYTSDGTFINSFGSTEEASWCIHKKTTSSISACARGVPKYKTAYGFKWSYNPPSELLNL